MQNAASSSYIVNADKAGLIIKLFQKRLLKSDHFQSNLQILTLYVIAPGVTGA